MSELKPCPFCGSKALTNIFLDYEDIENPPTEVTCENERCIYGWWLSPKDWNTRPIEDDLRKRIAELEAERRWVPVSERLPEAETRVLVATPTGYMEVDWRFSEPIIDCGLANFYSLDNVTHWMPLPEPPEVQQ